MYVVDLRGNIVYTFEGNKVYEGKGTEGRVVYTLDGSKVREGEEFWSPVAGMWYHGEFIVMGGGTALALYKIVGDKVVYIPRNCVIYRLVKS